MDFVNMGVAEGPRVLGARSFLVIVAASAGVLAFGQSYPDYSASNPQSVRGQVARAKQQGRRQIVQRINTDNVILGEEWTRLDEAVDLRTVVARLDGQRSYLSSQDQMTTWYKFSLLSTLRAPALTPAKEELPRWSGELEPKELLPLAHGAFLMGQDFSGVVVVDGVEVAVKDAAFPQLVNGTIYLMFLRFSSDGVGEPPMRAEGVYVLGADGDRLRPIRAFGRAFQQDVMARSGGSLSRLRAVLAGLPPR